MSFRLDRNGRVKMDKYERLMKELLLKNSQGVSNTDCLSEEMFAAYFDNLLVDRQKEKVEDHLSSCNACLQQSIRLAGVRREMENEGFLRAPHKATERAKGLVKESPLKEFFEVILEFSKESFRVLKDTGSLVVPSGFAPAGVREGTSKEAENVVLLRKNFDDVKAVMTIEKREGTCDIEIKASDSGTEAPLDGIRITLYSASKELASFLTVHGGVSFRNLEFGEYLFEINKGKRLAGKISLKLEAAP